MEDNSFKNIQEKIHHDIGVPILYLETLLKYSKSIDVETQGVLRDVVVKLKGIKEEISFAD